MAIHNALIIGTQPDMTAEIEAYLEQRRAAAVTLQQRSIDLSSLPPLMKDHPCILWAIDTWPSHSDLRQLGTLNTLNPGHLIIVVLSHEESVLGIKAIAANLGIVILDSIPAALTCFQLITAGAIQPWQAQSTALQSRHQHALHSLGTSNANPPDTNNAGILDYDTPSMLSWRANPTQSPICIGEPRDVAAAFRSLDQALQPLSATKVQVEDVDPDAFVNIIFGPSRALSDPSTKAALAIYDLPLPAEELCSSPSRAAAEANRLGFPVRLAVASPDLRIWDDPDLCIDEVDNAARVRDAYRHMMAQAKQRKPDARLMGVLISRAKRIRTQLRSKVMPWSATHVLVELGFADPHGLACDDRIAMLFPCQYEHFQKQLHDLRGHAQLTAYNDKIYDTLMRFTAMMLDWPHALRSLQVQPLALLCSGEVEVREACLDISDEFERSRRSPSDYAKAYGS